LILCRPSLFVLTLSVGYILCVLSYSIYWSQSSNKLTYLLIFVAHGVFVHIWSDYNRTVMFLILESVWLVCQDCAAIL